MNQEKDSKLPAASSPPSKRRKDNEGVALDAGMSWRDKSMKQFGLLDVPDGWKDAIARGTEEAWEKYYKYRVNTEDEPNHDELCEIEQRYLLKVIEENLDITQDMVDVINSMKIVLAADKSIRTGKQIII